MKDTSWNNVSDWYDELLAGDDTYQSQVILPNLMRLVDPKPGTAVLDIACGQGFFTEAFAKAGADVIGADLAPELIELAKKRVPQASFHVAPAHKLPIPNGWADVATIVLALQNIEQMAETIREAKRTLRSGGRLILVLNHPAYRIPKHSSWGWDESGKGQYRRVDSYLSESKTTIDMKPGLAYRQAGAKGKNRITTVSFHRPLQVYFKVLGNAGFSATRLEEWISHKKSEPGPRAKAEDKARKEFPLFLMLEAKAS